MNALFTKDDRAATQHILALWFPYLATERIRRQRLGRSWRSQAGANRTPPLVISHRDRNTQRVAALDEQAERLGLKPGMGIADVLAMHPGIEIVEAEPAADRRLLDSLADWCDRYTPLVALEGEAGLFLDITGCAHLFGGESCLLADLLTRLFQQGFAVRAGLASTPGSAWAAARFLDEPIITAGQEEQALARLPLAALRIDPMVRHSLESVGLRSVGAIMAAPRAPLVRRFGKGLIMRLDQALGRLEEAISPRLPVAPLSVERHLAEPIVLIDEIERLILLLGESLKADFERRGEGARTLQLLLFRVDGAVNRITVKASRPLREPGLIQKLFHERLAVLEDSLEAGFGFDLVRLSAVSVAPFGEAQDDLDGSVTDHAGDLSMFVDRVRARLGEEAVLAAHPVASHIPERAVVTRPWREPILPRGDLAGALAAPTAEAERPIRLFAQPEPVDVIAAEVPEGPPLHFRWRRVMHRVARAEGPQRIAPEWWREAVPSPTRDYFRVEDSDGRRYWLYRQGLYGVNREMPRWFMHGVFA